MEYKFRNVTLLITHYNRSESLERLLNAFKDLNCTFECIVVSDDSSDKYHVNKILAMKEKFDVKLITATENKGLGNNINKGQDAVESLYTLYVQEDFIPNAIFPEKLIFAVKSLDDRPSLDMVRFYSYIKYPYLNPIGEGFSEMKFSPFSAGYQKFYYYSDHPHLRRSSFFNRFGRYKEGIKSDVTEYKMMMSFLRNKGKAFYYDDYKGLFDQSNSEDEPSTVKRSEWKQNNSYIMTVIRDVFRYVKFNYNYFKP